MLNTIHSFDDVDTGPTKAIRLSTKMEPIVAISSEMKKIDALSKKVTPGRSGLHTECGNCKTVQAPGDPPYMVCQSCKRAVNRSVFYCSK